MWVLTIPKQHVSPSSQLFSWESSSIPFRWSLLELLDLAEEKELLNALGSALDVVGVVATPTALSLVMSWAADDSKSVESSSFD